MDTPLLFQLPTDFPLKNIEEILSIEFIVGHPKTVTAQTAYYDTFDWRLYNKSLVLHQEGKNLHLRRLSDGEILASLQADILPKFTRDFPECSFREQIHPLIHPRALLKTSENKQTKTTYRILNADEKTVAFLEIIFTKPSSDHPSVLKGSLPIPFHVATLELRPVRGYLSYSKLLSILLIKASFTFISWQDLFVSSLEADGYLPGSYSSKINVSLDPQMRSDEATRLILRRLFEVVEANEEGIRADIDPEYLHDFRVAIRRTRSALSQVQEVFPTSLTERFRSDFSILGSFTNELRDLDVYLLAEDSYKSMLPDIMREDINPLFDYLRSRRTQALRDVIAFMDSQEYAQILNDWRDFLELSAIENSSNENAQPTNAALAVIELANKRIIRWYRRVIADGSALVSQSHDGQMHALRIQCKKLRYLIEFFESLYPSDKVALLVNQLKKLQDNLGEFNDLSVQQTYLMTIADQLPIDQMQSRRALVAIGSLVNNLANRQEEVRAHFAETFAGFTASENQELVVELYGKMGKRRNNSERVE